MIARIYEVFPPLWDDCDVQTVESVEIGPGLDLAAQLALDLKVDQCVNW